MKTTTSDTKRVLIASPASASESDLLDAVYALYYLPHNYKLVYGAKDELVYQEIMRKRHDLAERVMLGDQHDSAPSVFADVIIKGGASQPMVVATQASDVTLDSASPEALASAILRVAQTA